MAGRRQLEVDESGPAMELSFQETDSGGPVLVYGTSYGDIVGWDLRCRTMPLLGHELMFNYYFVDMYMSPEVGTSVMRILV